MKNKKDSKSMSLYDLALVETYAKSEGINVDDACLKLCSLSIEYQGKRKRKRKKRDDIGER